MQGPHDILFPSFFLLPLSLFLISLSPPCLFTEAGAGSPAAVDGGWSGDSHPPLCWIFLPSGQKVLPPLRPAGSTGEVARKRAGRERERTGWRYREGEETRACDGGSHPVLRPSRSAGDGGDARGAKNSGGSGGGELRDWRGHQEKASPHSTRLDFGSAGSASLPVTEVLGAATGREKTPKAMSTRRRAVRTTPGDAVESILAGTVEGGPSHRCRGTPSLLALPPPSPELLSGKIRACNRWCRVNAGRDGVGGGASRRRSGFRSVPPPPLI
uniref:Uncharacterized protein n=1 Tax=Oryza punctata TaxID=4537 RepID=A0A0E0KGZ6_ORYPU